MTGSSRTKTATVNSKRGSSRGPGDSRRPAPRARAQLARQLEGWQPGLLAVFVAAIPAVLAVPRPVAPSEVPETLVEPRELDAIARNDAALAGEAERDRLDTDVRELGSAIRTYNLVDATDDAQAVGQERRAVADAAAVASRQGAKAIAALRAYQLASFLRELKRWESTGTESDELRELGGPFLERARKNGWIEGQRLVADEAVRAALFKKRWADLAMLRGLELAPSEQRALLAFLIRHPPRDPSSNGVDPRDRVAGARIADQADHYRLKKIEELRALDPAYPADLALGVVLYRLRRFPMAVEAFRRHLDAHPDGPYTLRAQNYLRAALDRANDVF